MKSNFLFVIILTFTLLIPNVFAESGITDTKETKDSFHKGTVEWISRCNMVSSTIIVRIIDYDMNKDPEKIEQFDVKVWSDSENRIVDYTVTETDYNTGIFNSPVFFKTTDESLGQRVQAFPKDTVFVKYIDYTLPNTNGEIEVINTFVMSELSVLEWKDDGRFERLAYDPCTLEYIERNKDSLDKASIFYPAPLKQIESGLYLNEIKCKSSLELIQKYDGSPACVKSVTVDKLVERGWANSLIT